MYVRTCSDIVFIFGSLDPCTVFLEDRVCIVGSCCVVDCSSLNSLVGSYISVGEVLIPRIGGVFWWGTLPRGHQGCRGSGLSVDLPPRV